MMDWFKTTMKGEQRKLIWSEHFSKLQKNASQAFAAYRLAILKFHFFSAHLGLKSRWFESGGCLQSLQLFSLFTTVSLVCYWHHSALWI